MGSTRLLVGPVSVLLLILCFGCSDDRPNRVPVSGKVMIDGAPLKYGYVEFIPSGARSSGGRLDENGRFKLSCFESGDGAVMGTHRVAVKAGEHRGETQTFWHAPKKYNTASTSGLTQKISAPTDSVVIDLTWDGQRPFLETHEGSERLRPTRDETN